MTSHTDAAGQSVADSVGQPVTRRDFGIAALAAGASFLAPSSSRPSNHVLGHRSPSAATNIVLVHGAFADGSSWSRVIPLLEDRGFNVTAVQNPLTSLPEDVATARRILDMQAGPTILVGHSYAGFVITEAGNAPNVVGLVYISSYGPDEGESHDDLVKRFPRPAGIAAARLDPNGFIWIERDKFREAFAHDVDLQQARIMAAVQQPVAKICFGLPVSAPAWKMKPSWFLISEDDRQINPDLQRFMAKRMGATVKSVSSSHASLVSHPVETAGLIVAAAAGQKA
jgi:pimeloyl-ACP methyl ester carboxylesterase